MADLVASSYEYIASGDSGPSYKLLCRNLANQTVEKTIATSEIVCILQSPQEPDQLIHMPKDHPLDSREWLNEAIQLEGSELARYRLSESFQMFLAPTAEGEPQRPLITYIVSWHAGVGKAGHMCMDGLLPLPSHIIEYQGLPHHTPKRIGDSSDPPDFITKSAPEYIIEPAKAGRRNLVILLSGDGGVVDVVNAIYSTLSDADFASPTFQPPTLAILPCGTGNALAHSSGIAADDTGGLSTLVRGTPRSLPVFRVTLPAGSFALDNEGHIEAVDAEAKSRLLDHGTLPAKTVYGAVVFSWALHSTLVADSDTPEYRKHGSSRFQMAAKELLFPPDGGGPHRFRGALQLRYPDGKWSEVNRDEHAYMLLTLVSNLEEKFCISPESRPLDGRMRLVHFAPHSDGGMDVMKIMEAAYDGGKHVQDAHVEYEEVRGIKLTIEEQHERWRRVCVDGKIFVVPRGGSIEVVKEERKGLELMVLDR